MLRKIYKKYRKWRCSRGSHRVTVFEDLHTDGPVSYIYTNCKDCDKEYPVRTKLYM